jgi:carbamoyl-phosphate synthase large subunit
MGRKLQNILVTAVGGIIGQGIIKCLRLANQQLGKNDPMRYRIFGCDMSPLAAGIYRCDHGYIVPSADSSDYADHLIEICKKEQINAIFVASDDELLRVAKSKNKIEKACQAKVIASPLTTISIARDKWKMYQFCKKRHLRHASTSLPSKRNDFIKEFGFPIVVKPREGYGSAHFYMAQDGAEINYAICAIMKAGWHPILQEYLPGDEFTIGVTVDSTKSKIMSAIVAKKILKHGQTYKAFIDDFPTIRQHAELCAIGMKPIGPINIQSKLVKGEPVIFEVNPRFSASCPMRAVAGINEPDIVYRNMVLDEMPEIGNCRKLVCMRYWNELYVPMSSYNQVFTKQEVEFRSEFIIPDYF